MNVRNNVYNLLKTLPISVFHTRLDPFKSDRYPVISVQNDSSEMQQIGHNLTYKVTDKFTIFVVVVSTDADADTLLDNIVDSVLEKLWTDAVLNTDYEYVPNISKKYGYVQAGESDLYSCMITTGVQYSTTFNPIINHNLQTVAADVSELASTNITLPI